MLYFIACVAVDKYHFCCEKYMGTCRTYGLQKKTWDSRREKNDLNTPICALAQSGQGMHSRFLLTEQTAHALIRLRSRASACADRRSHKTLFYMTRLKNRKKTFILGIILA